MHTHTRGVVALTAAALLAAGLSACSSSSGGGDSGPIKIGAIATLSGPTGTFPESTAAAKAYFDKVNKDGGIKGRQIQYTVVDDAADGSKSAQAARQLVDQNSVVALVGSASVPDCPTNAKFYASRKIASIPGAGVAAECFDSSNIAPTNTGLFTGLGVSLVYAVDTLHKTKPCILTPDTPSNDKAIDLIVRQFEKQTGVQVHLRQPYPTDASDFSSYLLRARQKGCDAFIPAVAGPPLVAMEKQITALGVRRSMTVIELSSAYNAQIAAAIQPGADGLLANSEFLPFTGSGAENPDLQDYVATMKSASVPLSAFGEGGYVAAAVIVNVLKNMKGDITAESVLNALQNMKPYQTPMMGNPYVFGKGDRHQVNLSSRFVQLKGTTWQPVSNKWTTLKTGD